VAVPLDLWNQLGGNPAGSGFRAVNSVDASAVAWTAVLPGPTTTSSPVHGPDAALYIGTANGYLVAVDPGGHLRWSVRLARDGWQVHTPAIADDGTVYCLCSNPAVVVDHRPPPRVSGEPSFVASVAADGTIRWNNVVRELPDENGTVNAVIRGAPRLLAGPRGHHRVIFVARYTLVVPYPDEGPGAFGPEYVAALVILDETGYYKLFNRYESYTLFVDAQGGGGFGGDGGGGDPPELTQHLQGARPNADTPVVFGSFASEEPWTIVAPGDAGLYTLRWSEQDQALTHAPTLHALPSPYPGPSAFPNDLVTAVSHEAATLLQAETLDPYVDEPTKLGGEATVAGGLRQMYFVVRGAKLLQVDADGAVRASVDLGADSVAYPAVSGNHVHVATMAGVRTFTLDLEDVSFVALDGAGYSSPAIGPAGGVHVGAGGVLVALWSGAPRRGLLWAILSWIRALFRG
jgi:PQQ-like domain